MHATLQLPQLAESFMTSTHDVPQRVGVVPEQPLVHA